MLIQTKTLKDKKMKMKNKNKNFITICSYCFRKEKNSIYLFTRLFLSYLIGKKVITKSLFKFKKQ